MRSPLEQHTKIAAFLSGNLSETESIKLERWRSASPENEQYFQEVNQLWNASGKKKTFGEDALDTDAEWSKLLHVMNSAPAGKTAFMTRHNVLLKVAASLLLLVGITYLLYEDKSAPGIKETLIVFKTDQSVRLFYLPDSTKVWLNINSSLSYSDSYGQKDRTTYLSGEGFFEVKPDQSKPFFVNTTHTVTRVLGTSYNVKEEEHSVNLSVKEGRVKFYSRDTLTQQPVTVGSNEGVVWKSDTKLTKTRLKDEHYVSWRERNNPVFNDEREKSSLYLKTNVNWRKNSINQSVIEGTITNTASLATYKNIVMQVTYTRKNGSKGKSKITVSESIPAGATLTFSKRLLDIFTATQAIDVVVLSAEVKQY